MKKVHDKDEILDGVPSGSNWKKILYEIYKKAPHMYGHGMGTSFFDDSHPLAIKLKIKGQELGLGISFLKDNGLIEDQGDKIPLAVGGTWSSKLILTKKGFDVILDIEKHKDNTTIQFGLFLFSGMFLLTTLLQILLPLADEKVKYVLLVGYLMTIIIISMNFSWGKSR